MFNIHKITLKKLTEYGLYLLVFILPLQTRWIIRSGELNGGYFEYGTISLYATDIVLLAVLLLFAIDLFKNKKILNPKSKITPQRKYPWGINSLVILAGLELTVFISCCFADNKLIAFYKYAWFILGIGFFFLIVKANYNRLKLLFSFFFGVFASASLGIWQFLNQSAFVNKWLGLAKHDPANPGVSVVEAIGDLGLGERWLRAYGTLDHPNMLGGLLTLGAIMIIFVIINLRRKKNKENYKYFILASYLFLLTYSFALFFTFSRTAWLSFVIGLFVILAVTLIKKDRFGQIQILKIILVSGILVFILFTSFQNLVLTRVKGESRLEQKSNTGALFLPTLA